MTGRAPTDVLLERGSALADEARRSGVEHMGDAERVMLRTYLSTLDPVTRVQEAYGHSDRATETAVAVVWRLLGREPTPQEYAVLAEMFREAAGSLDASAGEALGGRAATVAPLLPIDLGPPVPVPTRPPTWAERRAEVLAAQTATAFRCHQCGGLFKSLDVVERDGQLVGICRSDRTKGKRGPLKRRQREVAGTRRRRSVAAGPS
jgi:hypothetical protein